MSKVDIFSGFLGAGKTTLIKKLIKETLNGEKLVLIENEFGEIGIDGGFMKEAGIEVTEMNSGCICCSLVGDFGEALKKVIDTYSPDRILIEPSGVGKLSDVIRAVANVGSDKLSLNSFTAVADAVRCKMYMKNFGEFFNDQIEHAGCIVLSHTEGLSDEKINLCVEALREHNEKATVVTTPWDQLNGKQLLEAIEGKSTLKIAIEHLKEENENICPECGHHHNDDDSSCGCHHGHEHNHHHEHGHHHADDAFDTWGTETSRKYSEEEIKNILEKLENQKEYGTVIRAKGIVASEHGRWIHFDYVPAEADVRFGTAEINGRLCVIGSGINGENLKKLFNI